MDMHKQFRQECQQRIDSYRGSRLAEIARDFMRESTIPKYSYNFRSMGLPIIQYPQDMVAMQEIIWEVRPDLIVETGIAHGGSLIANASMLTVIEYANAVENGKIVDPQHPNSRVLGIDIDIREHNRRAISSHPLSNRIDMIQGSSTDLDIIEKVKEIASNYCKVLVCLDSNHTQQHVLAELEAYAPLTSKGSYCIVYDTIIEDLPNEMYPDRPWGIGDNPKTAVIEYLNKIKSRPVLAADGADLVLEVDRGLDNKLLISVAPGGYLKRI